MKKQSMKRAAAAVTALAAAMMATGAFASQMTVSAASNAAFPYTMYAGSDADGALTINAACYCVNGNLASKGTIDTSRKLLGFMNGKKTENAEADMPYISERLDSQYFSKAKAVDELNLKKCNINLNTTYDVAGEAMVFGNVNMRGGAIRAASDINITSGAGNFNNAVLYSEFGDIKLDALNVNFSGLIYAPLGNVEINALNVNLNNVVIIADTITLNAVQVNANYGKTYANAVGTESETKASYITKFNSYMMDKEAQNVLDILSKHYEVTKLDAGEFSDISVTAPLAPGMMVTMDFDVEQYEVKGYGNLSIMKTDGVQQMSTIVLTPFDKNMPLISTDYMFMGENRISYIEFYGLGIDGDENMPVFNELRPLQEKYARFADQPPTPGWFDEVRTMGLFKVSTYKDDDTISQMLYDSFNITLDASDKAPVLNAEQRAARYEITQDYVDHLISNPGVSTAIFNMCLGQERTSQFFNNVFFGTGLHQPQ